MFGAVPAQVVLEGQQDLIAFRSRRRIVFFLSRVLRYEEQMMPFHSIHLQRIQPKVIGVPQRTDNTTLDAIP
jgi:hypothetical protein